ncbi:MAG: hypothetical protein LBR72_08610 [Oscillospiraceae bacterium]|jgi:hypothetical protein|nr:hypothetical protein [Oscillospiraceae bacterium]
MKVTIVILLFLFFAALFFFTLFGSDFYNYDKVTVTTARVNGDRFGVTIPLDAVRNDGFGDYVYVLRTEQAYRNELNTVLFVPVKVLTYNFEDRTAYLPPNPPERDNAPRAWNGDRIVLDSTEPLVNGQRVVRAVNDKVPIGIVRVPRD